MALQAASLHSSSLSTYKEAKSNACLKETSLLWCFSVNPFQNRVQLFSSSKAVAIRPIPDAQDVSVGNSLDF
ncbi:hypothetical protein SLE2022_235040 [Rubroshorea leprosula]